jgi:hypothetical protein
MSRHIAVTKYQKGEGSMHSLWLRNSILLTVAAVSALRCSVGDSAPLAMGSGGTSGGGGAATGGTTTGSTGTGGATSEAGPGTIPGSNTAAGAGGSGDATTTTGAGGSSSDTPAPLPFVVDSLFIASGYMGDGAIVGAIAQDDNVTCTATRPPGATGHCHKFTYTPQPAALGGLGWGGVYWQYPVNNWGSTAGKRIAPGATRVTFYAAGAAGGESIDFLVGGISGMTYSDTLSHATTITLTNTMMPYIVDLTGLTYDAVLGGFGWVIQAPVGSTSPITFTVDSITWDQ